MILSKTVNVNIKPLNYQHYIKFYPNIKINDKVEVSVEYLTLKCDIKVKCICDICNTCKNLSYRKYLKNVSNYGYYSCKKCKNIKTYKTKELIYGDGNYNNSTKMVSTKIDNNQYLKENEMTPILKYRHDVQNVTLKNKKILFDNWNGFDFYDGEYIMPYLSINSNDKNYPTIDHKVSIFYGYSNNINPEIIGDINNLCITKRCINSSKGKN